LIVTSAIAVGANLDAIDARIKARLTGRATARLGAA